MDKHDQKRSSNDNGKKKGGIVKLKIVVKKLQKSLLLGKESKSNSNCNYCEKCEEVCDLSNCVVPGDVKEGHFAVIAHVDGEEPKKFVVPLSCLTHPTFLRLLEQAAEKYGFDRGGAPLAIPCRSSELERIILAQQ